MHLAVCFDWDMKQHSIQSLSKTIQLYDANLVVYLHWQGLPWPMVELSSNISNLICDWKIFRVRRKKQGPDDLTFKSSSLLNTMKIFSLSETKREGKKKHIGCSPLWRFPILSFFSENLLTKSQPENFTWAACVENEAELCIPDQ